MTLDYLSLITIRQSTTQNVHQEVDDTGLSFSHYSQTIYDSKCASGSSWHWGIFLLLQSDNLQLKTGLRKFMTLGYLSLITVRQPTTKNLHQEVYDTGVSFSNYSQTIYD